MMKTGSKVVGYVRVSTREQGDSGLGLGAQRAALEPECARRGWVLEHIYEDVASGKDTNRPQLQLALSAVESGMVSALVVAKLDRLSRSVFDFAGLLKRSTDKKWGLVVLDLGLDTSTPNGRFLANVMAAVAELERDQISTRTKDALAERRAQGGALGRPSGISDDLARRILRERTGGASYGKIARALNADRVPTAQGGVRWYPSTVRNVTERDSGPVKTPDRPCAVYRLRDAQRRLLYIGIAYDVEERTTGHWAGGHAADRSWWSDVVPPYDVEWYPNRDEAHAAEIAAIRAERPLHNGTYNDGPRSPDDPWYGYQKPANAEALDVMRDREW